MTTTATHEIPTKARRSVALLERRPFLSSIAVVVIVKVTMIAGIVLAAGVAGGASTPAGAAATMTLLALIPLALFRVLQRRGWATIAGFNGPAKWREPWLVWLPAAYCLLNLSNLLTNEIHANPGWSALLQASVQTAMVPLIEETTFRGLVLAVLLNRFHATRKQILGAVFLSSVLFGFWHLPNPNVPAITSVANIVYAMLAGVGFAAVVLRTRSIWLVMAAHALIVFANLISGALLSGNAVTVAETSAPEHAVRNAVFSVIGTLPLFAYGLWLLRDPRRLGLDFPAKT
jgi:membrane protease YdiL (CAAX protease family)